MIPWAIISWKDVVLSGATAGGEAGLTAVDGLAGGDGVIDSGDFAVGDTASGCARQMPLAATDAPTIQAMHSARLRLITNAPSPTVRSISSTSTRLAACVPSTVLADIVEVLPRVQNCKREKELGRAAMARPVVFGNF